MQLWIRNKSAGTFKGIFHILQETYLFYNFTIYAAKSMACTSFIRKILVDVDVYFPMQVWASSLKPQGLVSLYPGMQVKCQGHIFCVCRRAEKTKYLGVSPGPRRNSCKILTCITNKQINCDFLVKIITITVDIVWLWRHTNPTHFQKNCFFCALLKQKVYWLKSLF